MSKSKQNVVFFPIQGLYYPMVYSYAAKRQIAENGEMLINLQQAKEALDQGSDLEKIRNSAEIINAVTTFAEILIKQGCTYMNVFCKNYKIRENSAVNEKGVWKPISKDYIEAGIIDDEDFQELAKKIISLIANSKGTINTKSKEKNTSATQGK